MPALTALRRLLPYYRPYRSNVAIGLGLVVLSSALASVVPLFLRRALDGIRAGVPLRNIWLLALAMVGVSLFSGALRYWMRDLLNGVSRWIEYDLRSEERRVGKGWRSRWSRDREVKEIQDSVR